jgi:hypothetical protein
MSSRGHAIFELSITQHRTVYPPPSAPGSAAATPRAAAYAGSTSNGNGSGGVGPSGLEDIIETKEDSFSSPLPGSTVSMTFAEHKRSNSNNQFSGPPTPILAQHRSISVNTSLPISTPPITVRALGAAASQQVGARSFSFGSIGSSPIWSAHGINNDDTPGAPPLSSPTIDGGVMWITSRLRLVDLAGSEQAEVTGDNIDRRHEARDINQSLTFLSKCITSLERREVSPSAHHPLDSELHLFST